MGDPKPYPTETQQKHTCLQIPAQSPLLIVGGDDEPVIGMNQEALAKLKCPDKKLVIVPGATHLFEEPGTLEEVARVAAEWFSNHFKSAKKPQFQSVASH
jgi:alpha-beta hydrolase superfamily lysophospholipase